MRRKFGLRKQLILLIIIAIVNILILSGYNFFTSIKNLEYQIDDKGSEIVGLTSELIYHKFDMYHNRLNALTQTAAVKSMDWTQMESLLKTEAENWEMLFIANLDGKVWHTNGGTSSIAKREYFQKRLLKGESFVVTDPVFSLVTAKPIIVIAAPIIDNQKTVGFLAGTIELQKITELIDTLMSKRQNYHTEEYIVSAEGLFLSHPNSTFNLKVSAVDAQSSENVTASLAKYITQVIQTENLHGDYEVAGRKKIAFSREIPGTPGWRLVIDYDAEEIYGPIAEQQKGSLFGVIVSLVMLFLYGLIFVSRLLKKVRNLVSVAQDIGEGDLTVRAETKAKDEIGQLAVQFNTMADNVEKLIRHVTTVAASVDDASDQLARAAMESSATSEEISASIEEVASRANEQATSMEGAANSTKSLAREIAELGKMSEQVGTAAHTNTQNAQEGKTAIGNINQQMSEIKASITETTQVVDELVRKAGQISEIIEMINRIANQTQLLALNAAIEAARAGEAGKGFAVVASEIRALSEETVQSAAQINDLISLTQTEAARASESMNHGMAEVNEGSEIVQSTAAVFDKIVSAADTNLEFADKTVTQVRELIQISDSILQKLEDVAAIAQETSASSEEVSASTEEQAATMEEVAASAETLQKMADQLSLVLEKFKLKTED